MMRLELNGIYCCITTTQQTVPAHAGRVLEVRFANDDDYALPTLEEYLARIDAPLERYLAELDRIAAGRRAAEQS
jgi:hypothetical protein